MPVAGALRSSITPSLTNELRFGLNRAVTIFRGEVASPTLFAEWKGYCPTLGFSLTSVASVCGSSRRSSPVRELHDTMSEAEGHAHHHLRRRCVADQSLVPNGGHQRDSHDLFQRAGERRSGQHRRFENFHDDEFPGATSTQLSDAGALYALLTGRVASIGRSVAYDGTAYKNVPPTERNRQYEWGAFVQDSWRVTSDLTVTPASALNSSGRSKIWTACIPRCLTRACGESRESATYSSREPPGASIPRSTSTAAAIIRFRICGIRRSALLGACRVERDRSRFLIGSDKGKAVLRAGYSHLHRAQRQLHISRACWGPTRA